MKRYLVIALAFLSLLAFCACGKTANSPDTDEYVFETDYQVNMGGYSGAMSFMQGKDGLYLFRRFFLHHITENGDVLPLCVRSNCLHDSEECDAYWDAQGQAFYYNGSLYAVGASEDMLSYSLKQYTMEGRYVKDVFDLPANLQQVIQHRGVLYYTYYQESEELSDDEIGIPTLACHPMGKGKESVIFQNDDPNAYLGNMTAQGNQVYIAFDSSTNYQYLIYHIKTGELSCLDNAGEMVLYQNRLLFTREDGDRSDLYSAALDGTGIQPMEWTLKNEMGLFAAYEDILIEDNAIDYNEDSIKDGSFRQRFVVYKNGDYLFEFMMDDVDGKDYSQNICSAFRITEDAIYVAATTGAMTEPVRHRNLLRLDREAFERGEIQAEVVYTLD